MGNKTHERRAENSEALACAIVRTEHHFPFEGTGGVKLDGEDLKSTRNEAIRFLCAPL